MPKTKLILLEQSLVSMLDHCMGEAWVECGDNLPDVVVHNLVDGHLTWTVHGQATTELHYRVDFMFTDDDVCFVEWEQGVGIQSYAFPNPTEERFFIMAGMALAFQSNVLQQIQ